MITQDKKQPYWNLLALSALITMVSLGFACVNESNITEKKSKKSPKGDISYRVEYVTTDQLPYYKGELEELAKVLTDNLNYPEEAKKQRVQGTVHVRFLVTETGEIDEVEAINEAHPLLEAEAVRVIKTMPHWVAGKHKREAVAVWRFLPITFKLNGTAVEPQQLSWNSIADSAEGLHDYPGLKRLDKTPQFPGGKEALDLFIAKRNGVVGNSNNSSPFMVCFEVATDGSVGQMVNHPAMKLSERKRLQDIINQMPKWTPAERDGKKVPSYAGFNILVSNDSFEKQ